MWDWFVSFFFAGFVAGFWLWIYLAVVSAIIFVAYISLRHAWENNLPDLISIVLIWTVAILIGQL